MAALEERACPSAVDLLEYAEGQLSQYDSARVGEHVVQCTACAEVSKNLRDHSQVEQLYRAGESLSPSIPENARRLFAERSVRFQDLLSRALPEAPRFGQLWTTRLPDGDRQGSARDFGVVPRIVVVLVGASGSDELHESNVVVAPISLDTVYRSNYDLLVDEQASPLGYPFMAEVWNEVPMLSGQLGRYLGALPQPVKRYLGLLYQAHLDFEVDVSEFAGRLGPALRHSADPRARFQKQEIEACEYLRRPLMEHIEDLTAQRDVERPKRGILLSLRDLVVKYDRLPSVQRESREAVPLAAATSTLESKSYFVHATYLGGEILVRLVRRLENDSLYLRWERLAVPLHGKHAHIYARTRAGETFTAKQQSVHQGGDTILIQGTRMGPSQVESLTVEFVATENENGAIEHPAES